MTSYVIVGQTATLTATVSTADNSTNTIPISLAIDSSAAIQSPTTPFTTTTGVVIKGLTVGNATLIATFANPEGGSPTPVGSTVITVTSAAPTATITQNVSGTVSGDDSAAAQYQSASGTMSLGPFANFAYNGCGIGFETVGTITPNTYKGNVVVHRTIVHQQVYTNSTETPTLERPDGFDDTSFPQFQDQNPQSGGSAGKVYDVDGPGIHPPGIDGKVYRYRTNFSAYAALPDGTRISANYNFYVRLSCQALGPGMAFATGVAGDNQIGMGTTKTSWNLQ